MIRHRRGSVFVLSLIAVVAVTSILAIMASNQQVTFAAAVNRLEISRAKTMARSGIARAISELATLESRASVNESETWYTLGTQGDDQFTVGDDSFRMQIVDAGSLQNLNEITEPELTAMGFTQDFSDALLDWREAGTTPRTGGAKDEYYNSLSQPYNAALAPLQSVDELLLVKGFTPEYLYTPLTQRGTITFTDQNGDTTLYQMATVDSGAPNQDADGNAKTNINTAQQNQIAQAGITPQIAAAIVARRGQGFANMGAVLQTPGLSNDAAGILLDKFSTSTETREVGKVNINTASVEVLTTLPGVTSDIANSIFTRESTGFTALSELLTIPGVTVTEAAQFADRVTIGSDTFLVRVMGQANSTRYSLEAVIRVEDDAPKVLKIYETPYSDMRQVWRWADDTTNTIDLGENQ